MTKLVSVVFSTSRTAAALLLLAATGCGSEPSLWCADQREARCYDLYSYYCDECGQVWQCEPVEGESDGEYAFHEGLYEYCECIDDEGNLRHDWEGCGIRS